MDLKIGGKTIFTRVAKTPFQKFLGLMFQKEIKPLLFIFNSESRLWFHTLFMRVPIDLVFINAKKEIVDIQTANPWHVSVIPKAPAQYVLELPAKTATFKLGSKVSF